MSEEVQVAPAVEVADTEAQRAVAGKPAETTTSDSAPGTTDGDPGDVSDPEQAEADKALKRGKNYYGRKIDQLTREREQERAERQRLTTLLERTLGQPQPQQQPQKKPPTRDQFTDIEDFFVARSEYAAEQRAAQIVEQQFRSMNERQQQDAMQRQAQGMVESFNQRREAGMKDYPDFAEVIAEASDMPVGNAAAAIAEAENPAGVMYYLAKHRDQAERIASLSPLKAAIEIGRIESGLKAKPQVSTAPAPGKPVGSKPSTSGEPPDDPDAYMRWRAKNLR